MTRYRALTFLHYPTDPAVIARLLDGEDIPMDERGPMKSVEAGSIVHDLPETSVAGLLAKGRIEEVPDIVHRPRAHVEPVEESEEEES